MANFDRGRRGGARDFSRGGFKDRGPRGPVEMHKAICDKCRKECEVPFRPTSGKPVFCSNCFKSNRGSDTRSFEGRSNDRSNNFEDRPMFDAVCDDCGNSCRVPFQPRGDKPIYCSNCFGEKKGAGPRDGGQSQSQPQYKEQLDALNQKMDKILQLLEAEKEESPKTAIVEAEPKTPKKLKPKTT